MFTEIKISKTVKHRIYKYSYGQNSRKSLENVYVGKLVCGGKDNKKQNKHIYFCVLLPLHLVFQKSIVIPT